MGSGLPAPPWVLTHHLSEIPWWGAFWAVALGQLTQVQMKKNGHIFKSNKALTSQAPGAQLQFLTYSVDT